MSQQKGPYPPTAKDQNYLLLCQQLPKPVEAKVRSGIIERYTYKKDSETNLKTRNVNYSEHACSSKSSELVQSNASCASGSSGTVRPILINHDSQVSKSYDRTFLNSRATSSPLVINGMSKDSVNEKVRTEHCDSTTDIIENVKSISFGVPRKYRSNSTPNHCLKLKSEIMSRRYSSSHISDSDSDCQIIDCNSSNFTDENGKISQNIRYLQSKDGSSSQSVKKIAPPLDVLNKQMENPNTKVLSWMESESEPDIHVISDDEIELVDKPVDHQQQTTYISTITTINGQDNAQLKAMKLKPHISIDMSPTSDNKNKLIEKGLISQLPPQFKNSLSFINEKYQKVKSQIKQTPKTEMISTPLKISNPKEAKPPELCSITTLMIREKSPPGYSKIQSPQKINVPMSPESMKSEFYNYLKINTNPSAQKEEIVEKNRRSTRVKNLILQMQKAREQNSNRKNSENSERNEEEEKEVKKKDIRKKYLKYSKLNVTFPSFPTEHNTSIIDFNDFIESYFQKEDIPYEIKEKENDIPVRKIKHKIRHTRSHKLIVTRSLNRKIMMRPKYKSLQVKNNNKLLKVKKRIKPLVAKMIGCTPHISDIKIDRLRYKPNKAFRHSLLRNSRKYAKNMSRTRIRKSNSNRSIAKKEILEEEMELKAPENRRTTSPVKNVIVPIKRTSSPTKKVLSEYLEVDCNELNATLDDLQINTRSTSPFKKTRDKSETNPTVSNKKIVERKLSVSSTKSTEMKVTSPESKLIIREVKSPDEESKNYIRSRPNTPAPKLIITEVKSVVNKEAKTSNRSAVKNKITIAELSSQKPEIPKVKAKITIKEIRGSKSSNDSSRCSTPGYEDSDTQPLLHNILAEKLSVVLQKNKNSISVSKYNTSNKSVTDMQTAISKKRSTMHAVSLNSIKNLQIQSEEAAALLAEPQAVVRSKRKIIKRRYIDFEGCETTKTNKKSDKKKARKSPDLFGFEKDNLSAQRCRAMQNIISNLSIDILVSSSPIETPEPMEQLMPEVRIDSVPIENEPCNLQEVISKVSAEYLSSKELITPLHEDDSTSTYSNTTSDHEELVPIEEPIVQELFNTALIEKINPHIIPLNQSIKPRSFHRSLMQAGEVKRKSFFDTTSNRPSLFEFSDSDSSISTAKGLHKKSPTHEIDIYEKNGPVYNSYYINGVLIIVQELLITFWKQTALGNILGAQNMWLPHGNVQRISLERGCINKRSSEMILSSENSVAYIELWTKEHESKYRECPIADIFATIYFHRGHGMPDKKVLQLENIKGYGYNVRFAVIRHSREIIVSWCDTFSKPIKTLVRSYQLAPDFQTISSVKEMESVLHYISSMHNIHDCDDLVMGSGNEQISVWNLRHGYLVTTLNLSENPIQSPLESKTLCLYAQCDTGFLFLLQQSDAELLRLVAVNGMTQEWKQLQSYQVPHNYKQLLGIVVESGVLMTCYTNGFLCWNINNGQLLAEIETQNELIVLPSNKYLVTINNYRVTVQHVISYILQNW